MIIVAGHLSVDPAVRDAYVAGCRQVVELARNAPGCLDFTITADPLDPGRVDVYERWESDEAVEAFRGSGPSDAQQAQILGADVARYRISSVEAP